MVWVYYLFFSPCVSVIWIHCIYFSSLRYVWFSVGIGLHK